MIANKDPAS